MHNVIHKSLENFFKIANFSGFLTFLKILHFSARILPILEFYLPKLDLPFLSLLVLLKWQVLGSGLEIWSLMQPQAAQWMHIYIWTENLNFGKSQQLLNFPKGGVAKSTTKGFFLLHLLPFKVSDGMKLPRSILTRSCSFLLICMCLRINVQFGGNFLWNSNFARIFQLFNICPSRPFVSSQSTSPRFRLNFSSSCRRADRYHESFWSNPSFKTGQDFEFLEVVVVLVEAKVQPLLCLFPGGLEGYSLFLFPVLFLFLWSWCLFSGGSEGGEYGG